MHNLNIQVLVLVVDNKEGDRLIYTEVICE